MNPDRHEIEPHTSATVGAREETPLARRWEPLGPIWRQHPRNANPDENAGPAPGAHAPHSPASASDAQPNARQRPPPAAPPRGGRHRGGVGTPLEGTYFQAKLGNAMCVQSLDDSLNSAIHITYRISLRSSSLREPRYPSTGVVVRFVWKARASLHINRRARAQWGGAEQANARGVGTLPNGALATYIATRGRMPTRPQPAPHRRGRRHAEAVTRTTGGPYEEQGPVRTGFGMDTGNDPSAGSPTETLLRLLLPLNNKVWTASRSVASGEPNASPQSGGLTGSFNR